MNLRVGVSTDDVQEMQHALVVQGRDQGAQALADGFELARVGKSDVERPQLERADVVEGGGDEGRHARVAEDPPQREE